ncbi:1245_t:CDS:2, partial [Cetraspora pellucida]
TEEKYLKFKTIYYKTIDTLENQDDDNQKLEENASLLENENNFKKSFEKNCCEKNCLQTQVEYSMALTRYLNFKNLSKSFQDMYLLGIIVATKRPEIVRNSKKSKLTTEYTFEGKSIQSIKLAYEDIQKFGIKNIIHSGKPNSLDIIAHISWNYAQQIQLPYSSQQEQPITPLHSLRSFTTYSLQQQKIIVFFN